MAECHFFLKIEGIEGESQDAKHRNEIELLNFSWSERQSGTFALGGGGGAGKVKMEDAQFVMNFNKASPKLMLACATGEHIKQAVLTCRKAGKEQQPFIKMNFTDLIVSSFETNGNGVGSYSYTGGTDQGGWNLDDWNKTDRQAAALPLNFVGINFATIEIEYKQQNADGTLGAGSRVKYDLKKNQAG